MPITLHVLPHNNNGVLLHRSLRVAVIGVQCQARRLRDTEKPPEDQGSFSGAGSGGGGGANDGTSTKKKTRKPMR